MFKVIKVLNRISSHPLNKNKKFKSILRFLKWQTISRILPNPINVKFVNDTKLSISRGMTGATGNIYSGLSEYEEMGFLLHYLRKDETFVDIGANVGSFTVLASGAIGAKTISFEPLKKTFKHLKKNISLNKIDNLVQAKNIGLSDKNNILFFTKNRDTMNRVIFNRSTKDDVEKIKVKKLDDVIKDIEVSFIKIDVEGFELPVLRGAKKILSQNNLNALIVETNENGTNYGYNDSMVNKFLISIGFNAVKYNPRDRKFVKFDKFSWNKGNTIYLKNIDLAKLRVNEINNFILSTGDKI